MGHGGPGRAAREVVADAAAAVAGDSTAAVAARWAVDLRRDPADRGAELGLAELARRAYAFARADSLYTQLVTVGGAPDDFAVYARLGEAEAAYARGRLVQMDSLLALATTEAGRLGDRAAETEALIESALAALRLRGPGAADALFRRAARELPAGSPELAAEYHCARASELVLENEGAAEEAERGLALAKLAREPRLEARCLMPLGADLARRGASDSALAVYRTVVADLRRVRDDEHLASALQWLGGVHRDMGELGDARQDLVEAVALSDSTANASAAAWALNNLAWISLELDDPASAAGYATRAESLFAGQSDRYGLAVTREQEGAVAAELGDLPQAEAAYADALGRFRALRFGYGVTTSSVSIAYFAMDQHDWAGASEALDRAEAVARRFGLKTAEPELAYHSGALALRQGRLREAALDFRRALRESGRTRPELTYTVRVRLAEISARSGAPDRAAAELSTAEDALDGWRASLNDRQLRVLAFQVTVDQSDPGLGIATVIAAVARSGDLREAFRLAERERARELGTEMIRARASAAQAVGVAPAPRDTAAGAASPTPESRALTPSGTDLDSVEAALPDDSTAFLEYVADRGDDTTTLFLITRRGAIAVFLASEDSLAAPVARLDALLASGADPRPLARRLGALLLDSALHALPPRVVRLVIAPDGSLLRLPFATLLLADGNYVGERYDVSLMPSAGVAVRLWRRPRRTDPARLLIFADPAYARAAPDAGGLHAVFAATGGLPRLPGAAREARLVASYAPAVTLLEGAEASEAWLTGHPLAAYRVIHFATHAVVDNASVSRTALALAPGGGRDGFVEPGELARLHLAADLVVLSACRTADGAIVRGEGLQGLTAPLLEAGARSVLVTWWPIDDAQTLRFMRGFYGALAAGRSAGQALQQAKLAMLRSGAPPRAWAAFTLVGDESVRVPLRAPAAAGGPAWVWALAAAGLVVAGAYRVSRWKRRASERGRVPSRSSA